MTLQTASAVISFAKKLEDESAKFYEDLSQRYAKDKDVFLAFVRENGKNVMQIERVYYEVITDAIEGGFAFNLNPDKYTLETELAENTRYSATLNQAIAMEEKIVKFYSEAAEQAKSLLADLPRAFTMVAKKRGNRRTKLELLND